MKLFINNDDVDDEKLSQYLLDQDISKSSLYTKVKPIAVDLSDL